LVWKNKTVPSEGHFSCRFHPYTGFPGKPSARAQFLRVPSQGFARVRPCRNEIQRFKRGGEKYFRGYSFFMMPLMPAM
jgi:hypothetical protein